MPRIQPGKRADQLLRYSGRLSKSVLQELPTSDALARGQDSLEYLGNNDAGKGRRGVTFSQYAL